MLHLETIAQLCFAGSIPHDSIELKHCVSRNVNLTCRKARLSKYSAVQVKSCVDSGGFGDRYTCIQQIFCLEALIFSGSNFNILYKMECFWKIICWSQSVKNVQLMQMWGISSTIYISAVVFIPALLINSGKRDSDA